MAIDYIIDKSCAVKEDTGVSGLVDLVKSRNRAMAIYKRMLESGHDENSALDAGFFIQTMAPDGESVSKEVSVRELLRESKVLKELANHCSDCELNRDDGFGCYQTIQYPISGDAERWLAQLVQVAWEKGLPFSILIRFIQDEEVSGELYGELRKANPKVYQELTEPVLVEVGDDFVNTNQILDMMFTLGVIERTHQMFLLFLSGGVEVQDHEPDPEQFTGDVQAAAIRQEGDSMKYWIFSLPPSPSDDPSILQIKAYFKAVFAAFATGHTLSLDY